MLFLNIERSCVSNAWWLYSRSPSDEAEAFPSTVGWFSVVGDSCKGIDLALVIGRVSWVSIDTVCGFLGVVSCFPSVEISLACIKISSNILESLFVSLNACEDYRIEDWALAASSISQVFFSYDSINQKLVCSQFGVNFGDLSIICGNDAVNRLADGIDNRDLLQIFAANCSLHLLMETLVATSIVCQCLGPPVFLFSLHISFQGINLLSAGVCRGSSDSGVTLGKIEDIPGVLWIFLGTRNEFIGKPCTSGCNSICIGLVESVSSVIRGLAGIVRCQSRIVGRFSCGHWGLPCITLGLESRQSCRFRVCDEVLCKSGLESWLTSWERLRRILCRELVVVVDNWVKWGVLYLICYQLISLGCRCTIIGAAICLPCVHPALQLSICAGVCWHVGSIGSSRNEGNRVVIGCFLGLIRRKECLLLGNSTSLFISAFSGVEISL